MKKRQHKFLKDLSVTLEQILDNRPLDSEDDNEESIWDLIEELSAELNDFLSN